MRASITSAEAGDRPRRVAEADHGARQDATVPRGGAERRGALRAWAIATLAGAAAVAALGLARRRLPRAAARAVDTVRALHSGRPGDYVAWAADGAATLAGLFALTLG